jgi:hypothetical protein
LLAHDKPTYTTATYVTAVVLQVNITSSLAVRSMIVYGEVQVIPPSGTANLVINSSFILVRGKQAKFSVSGTAWNRTVTIYLRRCG